MRDAAGRHRDLRHRSDPGRHRAAGGLLQRLAVPPGVRYRTDVVTSRGGPVSASCGLEFASSPIGDIAGPVDTLMVAGGADMDAATGDQELLHHVRRLAADARRVTSVCSGAFVLAAAGLLDGSTGNHPLGRMRSAR